jgi:hypothetical protein
MLFFILVVAAVVGIAVYVSKKTKSKPTSFLAPGETLTADPIEVIPTEPKGEIDLGTPNPPKFETSGETEITPAEAEPVNTYTPKMSAKPKKKPQPKKKPATKVNA